MAVSEGRILVTGGSRGIGAAVVRAVVAKGGRVLAVGRDQDALVELAREAPDRITVAVGNLQRPEQRDALVGHAVQVLGGLDGLVNCAGIVHYAELDAIEEGSLRAQLEVNFVAPLFLCQAAARVMRAQGTGGGIVNVSSTLGQRPAPKTLVYAATKAALDSMTRSLAIELAPDGIHVNAVVPGVVDTEMVRVPRVPPGEAGPSGAAREAVVAEQLEELRRLHPLGRLGRPDEVARAVIHLLDSEWTTGTLLTVDGGLSI